MLYPAELLSQMTKIVDYNQFSSLRKQLIKSAFLDWLQEPLINFLIQKKQRGAGILKSLLNLLVFLGLFDLQYKKCERHLV